MNRKGFELKKGFYYHNSKWDERCFYLTGSKSGNKWIHLSTIHIDQKVKLPNPKWGSLLWTCLPSEEELNDIGYTYSETNPIDIELSV